MRILWFTNNSAGYKFQEQVGTITYGGWMSSLQNELTKQPDVELGVCFCAEGLPYKEEQDGVIYYPVPNHRKAWKDKLLDAILFNDESRDKSVWPYYIEKFKDVILDFNPDVIQIFGSELYMGLATFSTDLPLMLHIQGILNPYSEVYFPPGFSIKDYVLLDWNPFHMWKRYYNFVWWKRSCYRERMIIQHTRHYVGRTDWDQRATYVLNPDAIYHFGEEIMRPIFYEAGTRTLPQSLVINTVISAPFYKGFDLILKTANLLKNNLHRNFTWNVYGGVAPTLAERVLNLYHKDLNIILHGIVSADVLCSSHLESTVYVHSSYIENGCNAIIEAQMCGCAVIANYVGGLNNTIKHENTGLLVPANDPYQTAYLIDYLYTHPKENVEMGLRGRADALARHDRGKIVKDLLATYKSIIQDAQ